MPLQKDVDFKFQMLLVLAMMTWGLSWTNGKILGNYNSVEIIILWRFFFAALFFFPILIISKVSILPPLISIPSITLNASLITFYNIFYFAGTKYGYASTGGVLVTTLNPILTTIILGLLFKKRIPEKDWFALILAVIGSSLITQIWNINQSLIIKTGNIYFLGASLSWVCVTINTSISKKYINYMTYTFWSFFFGFLISFLFASNKNIFIVFNYDWIFWTNLIIISIGAMAFGQSIYFKATSILGPQKASSYILMVPITAVFFAIILLGESINYFTILGGSLSLIAILIINKKTNRNLN